MCDVGHEASRIQRPAGVAWCFVDASSYGFGGRGSRKWFACASGQKDAGENGWRTGYGTEFEGVEG